MTVKYYDNHNAITMCLTMPIVLAKIFLGLRSFVSFENSTTLIES